MAGKIKGITIEIGGDVQPLNKALEEVNKKSRDIQSELRQVERLLKLDPKNTELLAQKQKLLSDAISNTKEKLDTLREAERQVQEQFKRGEIGEEQYRALQREIIKTEEELKKLNKQLNEMDWKPITDKLDKFGKTATDIGKSMSAKVTAPILGVGAAAAKMGMDFEAAMSKVQALSGATAEEMAKLEKQAREMGAATVFSASEAAEAQAFLAMAGYDVAQIMDSLPGLLDLAAAGQLDLGRAADITTNIMSGFNIEAEKTAEVADVLAKAAASANTSVEQMGDAMSYVAPVAAGAGLSLEETAAAIGILSNAGIQGQRAGTALRGIIASLQNPTGQTAKALETLGLTVDDVNPSMHSLTDILRTLQEAGMDSSQAMQLVGTASGPALIALMSQGSEGLAEFTEQLENADGAAARMAETMTDNLYGRIQEMKSAFEEVALTIYDNIQPALEWLVEQIKGLADWFNNLSPSMQNTIIVIAGIAAAIGPLLIVLGQMSLGLSSIIKLIGPLTTGLTGATGATGGLSAVIAALTGPIGIAVAAIVAITAVIVTLWKTNEDFREGIRQVWENIKEIIDGVIKVIKGIIQAFIGLITGDWTRFTEGLKNIWSGMWQAIRNIVAGAWDLLSTVFNTLKNNITNFFTGMIRSAVDWGRGLISSFIDGIKSMIGRVRDAVSSVVGTVKDYLGFSSPAKKGEGRFIEDWGYNMIEGFMDGMKKAMPQLQSTLNAMIPNMSQNYTSSTFNTTNSFVVHAVIREENDIKKVAQELYKLQQQSARGRGLAPA